MMLLAFLLAAVGGCSRAESKPSLSPGSSAAQEIDTTEPLCTGSVMETMDAGGYTYVRVECEGQEVWAAGPQTPTVVGDEVTLSLGMPMAPFHSRSLNRTFDRVYFVSSFHSGSEAGDGTYTSQALSEHIMAQTHDGSEPQEEIVIDFSGIDKAEGGWSVAEILADKDRLSGKEVLVRGKVVKFNSEILGTNWIHLQDGTGSPEPHDVTITTAATASIGDTVLVRGTVALDRDFGFGYRYDVLIEEAVVTVE
jgi:hypothetical protein